MVRIGVGFMCDMELKILNTVLEIAVAPVS